MNSTSCFFGSRFACAQTVIFSAELCSKNEGETSLDYGPNPNQNRAALRQTFSSNKSVPAKIGRILFKPWSEQARGWIHFCMKQLRTLKSFQIFRSEIEKSKTYSSWCPFQGLSNGTTLMKIHSGRMVRLSNEPSKPHKGDDSRFLACSLSIIFMVAFHSSTFDWIGKVKQSAKALHINIAM